MPIISVPVWKRMMKPLALVKKLSFPIVSTRNTSRHSSWSSEKKYLFMRSPCSVKIIMDNLNPTSILLRQ